MSFQISPGHVMTTPEAAEALGLRPHQFEYLLRNKFLREAAIRVGGRRLFTQEEITNLRTILAAKNQRVGANCGCGPKEVKSC